MVFCFCQRLGKESKTILKILGEIKMTKTVLITGASTGIGRSAAKLFQEKGWNVIATMRSPEKETELNTLDNVLVNKLDVLDLDTINNSIREGVEKFGTIDALVNNAGYGAYGPLEATPRENVIRQFAVNVQGLLDTTQAVLPVFRKQKSGVIVNISSIGGKMTFPLGSLYHGTKFAVEGISEALSYEMDAIGVKVKIVEPGAINTDFASRSFNFNNDESMEEYQPVVQKLMQVFEQGLGENASSPELVADVIYNATTDETSKLRYTAGPDAELYMKNRKELDDETFIGGLKQQIGL
jgi:short-subunit dehydrogenase